MTYPYEAIFNHFAGAIAKSPPPKDNGAYRPILAIVNARNGRVDSVKIHPDGHEFFASNVGIEAFNDFIERTMARIETDPKGETTCITTICDAWMIDDQATAEAAAAAGDDLAGHPAARRYILMTIYRPAAQMVARIPVVDGVPRVDLFNPIPPGTQVH